MVCAAIKPDGSRCKAAALRGGDHCWFHDPNRSEARREASARGGEVPAAGTGSGAARALRDQLAGLYAAVRGGEIGSGTGAVLAQITNAQLRAVALEVELAVDAELLERLDKLERALEKRDARESGAEPG